jgi:hypothetical protein
MEPELASCGWCCPHWPPLAPHFDEAISVTIMLMVNDSLWTGDAWADASLKGAALCAICDHGAPCCLWNLTRTNGGAVGGSR